MKIDIRDMFDDFYEEDIEIQPNTEVSHDDVFYLTIKKLKENEMKNNKRIAIRIPILVFSILMMVSATIFAAYKYLEPKEVANLFGDYKLAQHFSEDDTIFNFEPQTSGDYTMNVLGITSGRNLSTFDSSVDKNKSYIVGAISRTDGKPIKEYIDQLTVTPLVKDYKPWDVNIYTLDGSNSMFIYDGVEYFIEECDNIEIFANHDIYVAIYGKGSAPSSDIFNVKDDGSIEFNENFKKMHALFTLPINKNKADENKVKELFKKNNIPTSSNTDDSASADDFVVKEKNGKNSKEFTIEEKTDDNANEEGYVTKSETTKY